jgi:N-methylhydantoinase A
LNPDYFLGGTVRLSMQDAQNAVANLAKKIGMSVEDAALGIVKISTANMVQAIREVTVERGSDPRQFVLVPFGGAGPTQGVDIAEALNIDLILIPRYPGITSAFGLVSADLRVDLMKTVLLQADASHSSQLKSTLKLLSEEAKIKLAEQGAQRDRMQVTLSVDMRYAGQSHELPVVLQTRTKNLAKESVVKFESLHETSFGYAMRGRGIEWVTARVSAKASSGNRMSYQHTTDAEAPSIRTRRVVLGKGESASATVYRRNNLSIGQEIQGPAMIEQLDTTTYIGPDWTAEQRPDGPLWMRRSGT